MRMSANFDPVMYSLIVPTHWAVSVAPVIQDMKAMDSSVKVSGIIFYICVTFFCLAHKVKRIVQSPVVSKCVISNRI